jgi:RND family efflux transporter MFP subunit
MHDSLHPEPAAETMKTRRVRRSLLFGVLAGLLALAIGLVLAVDRPDDAAARAPTARTPALTVTSAIPRETRWPVTLNASGAIAAWEEASIGAQIGGYQLIDVSVNVGDTVKKGQVLARFDRALLLADKAQLQASAEQAAANRERGLSLKKSGLISDQDLLQLITQAKTADALLAAKELQLRYTAVVAPDDGVISSRTATLGTVAAMGDELFRMFRRGRLEWRGEMTAARLALIEPGKRIVLTLPDGSEANAKVRQTAPALDVQSRLALVYADIEPGSRARAGMYVKGQVILDDSPALVVPAQSVVIRDGRSYVLKIDGTSSAPTVHLQGVTVGRRLRDEVEIVQGLSADDRVVVQGAGFLNDGDVVRLDISGAPPTTGGTRLAP